MLKKQHPAGVNRNMVLFITMLVSLMTAFLSSSVNIALPAIGSEFRLDAVMGSVDRIQFGVTSATPGNM